MSSSIDGLGELFGSKLGLSKPASPKGKYPSHFVKSQEHLLQSSEYNPEPTTMPPPSAGLAGAIGERHVISFVGMPARGKQFMAERLCRYLKFFHGAQCRIFDLADEKFNSDQDLGDALSKYLEEEDETATTQLLRSLEGIDEDSLDRLKKNVDSGKIAILDTSDAFKTQRRAWSGSSKETRWAMQKHCGSLRVRVKLLFIEVIVTDTQLVRKFLRQRTDDVDAAESRIREFGRAFVTIQDDGSEDDLAYVKLINYGEKVVTNRIRGFLLMQIVKYLSHVHPNPRTVYVSRHGQSQYNVCQKIGGNPGLTASGERFARWLGSWVPAHIWPAKNETGRSVTDFEELDADDEALDPHTARPLFGRVFSVDDTPVIIRPARLWTSTLKRTIDTARHIPHPVLELRGGGGVWHQMLPRVYRNLDELFAGDYEGMTYKEIEANFGGESILRKRDKLGYRYPRGESYLDLIARLDPLMHELESYAEPLLIVSHQATLRILYAYLVGIPRAEAPKIEIPLHTIIKIEWDGWQSFNETRFHFDDPAAAAASSSSRADNSPPQDNNNDDDDDDDGQRLF
ncbi:hypothetical protein CTAYLR_004868 [Chrysophaeum taylorii]|uniref:6-phosphofructo-2-kinase domain-containing protein n=1 Tax=Chrysophaeum taylorii TaxID=2483200 RepID=A0AAD7UEA6_9STRA|nr:hypothetical protein CTAYLR_004868 [Chrysophaeum taylorii]